MLNFIDLCKFLFHFLPMYGGLKIHFRRLDLYLPKDMDGPKPVIAFITGGAWIIGSVASGLSIYKFLFAL